jgi:hypothetical protein
MYVGVTQRTSVNSIFGITKSKETIIFLDGPIMDKTHGKERVMSSNSPMTN